MAKKELDIEAIRNRLFSDVDTYLKVFGVSMADFEKYIQSSKNEIAKTPIKENMCFTIEPGLYNPEHFGVRLENSCYLKDGKIKSFVKMNYENKLIDYTLLSEQEKEWLKEFEVL